MILVEAATSEFTLASSHSLSSQCTYYIIIITKNISEKSRKRHIPNQDN